MMNWVSETLESMDTYLASFFEKKVEVSREYTPASSQLIDAIAGLTLRGGKRIRPHAVAAVYQAIEINRTMQNRKSQADALPSLVAVGAALELLQTYLLIHDDWMDNDATRRGGPSVHVLFKEQLQDTHLGASMAVLAGDLACTYAWDLMLQTKLPDVRKAEALGAFTRMQEQVVFGQQLDLLGSTDVERVENLKTGSYTVAGPMILGGILADASDEEMHLLTGLSYPLGIAFQLRDDLLGTFGDARAVGKPVGNDLKAGKRTSIIVAMERLVPDAQARTPVTRVLGRQATDSQVAEATRFLERCGAKSAVEAQLQSLCGEAHALIALWPEPSREVLSAFAEVLTQRNK